jgi:GT2 family glycosyltransferase
MKNNHNQSQISFSQEEFIKFCYLSILEREADEQGLKDWLNYLNKDSNLREMIKTFIHCDEFLAKQLLRINRQGMESILGENTCIIGEQIPLTPNQILSWYQKAGEQLINGHFEQIKIPKQQLNNLSDQKYNVAIINSLYRGEKYLNSFLNNLVGQSIFNQCQLIIIDANSPENEQYIIQEYCDNFKNIKYLKIAEKIGIYEAWNLGINYSNTEYITNANVDDLHRYDALELKVEALKNNPKIDVVYSDVYYSFIANLPFEKVAKCGLRSNLPIANKDNLMLFNSPHNSPMWRRSLHKKIGYFDTQYQSAADYEFWLRAAFSGVKFMKISEPVTLYYNNPQGISTRKNTKSIEESKQIVKFYKSLLDSNNSESWYKYCLLIYETKKQQNKNKLELLKQQLQHLQEQHLTKVEAILEGMLTSKFWKIRSYLYKLKTLLNPNLKENKKINNQSIDEENTYCQGQKNRMNHANDPLCSYLSKNNIPKEIKEKLTQFKQEIKEQYLTLKQLEDKIKSTQIKIELIKTEIETIKRSKFWQLRNIWFRLKSVLTRQDISVS